MVTWRPVYFLWGAILLVIAALCVVGLVEYWRICDLSSRLSAATAEAQRRDFERSGAIVAKDVPAPPVPLPLRNQVDAVRRAVPEAKPERSEQLETGWIEAQGPVLPCVQSSPAAGSPGAVPTRDGGADSASLASAPDGSGGALLRPGDRFRIHLVSVDLTTPQGATGTVGEGELLRFDGASLGRGPLDQDASTVTRRQRPQDAPRWWAVPSLGVTSRARAWAGVAIGRGRWGGVLAGAWKPGDAEVFVGGSARF